MTATRQKRLGAVARRLFSLAWLPLTLAAGCESDTGTGTPTGGETHFLTRCEVGSGACGADLSCVCGVCTLPCDGQNACGELPGATCRASTAGECGEAHCDVSCAEDADCAGVSASHRCEAGFCRPDMVGTSGSGGSPGEGGAGGQGGAECASGAIAASEVVVLGDTFFSATHEITAYLQDLARDQGAISAAESYRDQSNLMENALALGGNGIATQYSDAVAEGAVKVVIMNGGGADMLLSSCDPSDTSCPDLAAAASALNELLETMAGDGVVAVVYAFYPDPVDTTARARVDLLRPLIQAECAASPVDCTFIDLREAFAGNYAEYISADGFNPTEAGSRVVAEIIWSTMQSACIAQ